MALTGNKGEWSEIYTLLKLLGEGKMYAGDQDLNKLANLFYPIIKILRQEKGGKYNYAVQNPDIVITTPEGEELLRKPASEFLAQANVLLNAINKNRKTFSVSQTETFMSEIFCHSLKAKSSDKTDIKIILHDPKTRLDCEMGFSIKSQLGGNATLLNASKSTNFNFKIKGAMFSDEEISQINAIGEDKKKKEEKKKKVLYRVNTIKGKGAELTFDKIDNPTFRNNLTMLDGDLPKIMGHLLLAQLDSESSTMKVLSEKLAESNPLNYETKQPLYFYVYKIKHLLTSMALGMMPATVWDGKFDANGGYLVVKKDGDILCYHFYDRNRFEDFLFTNAYLERSSTTRHQYASIIKESDGTLSFKLNLQIRLK